MSDAPLSLPLIRATLSAYVPPDPVALDILLPESREFLSRAASMVTFLLSRLEAAETDKRHLDEALDLYARQSGDVLFHQNVGLCLQQVRQQKV